MTFKGEVIFGTEKQRPNLVFLFKKKPQVKIFKLIRPHLRIRGVDVVNGNSPLNASQGKTCRLVLFVFKNSHTAMLQLGEKVYHHNGSCNIP